MYFQMNAFLNKCIHSESGGVGASAVDGKKEVAQLAGLSSFKRLSEPAHNTHLTHQWHCALMLTVGPGSRNSTRTHRLQLAPPPPDIIQWHLSPVHNPTSSHGAKDPFAPRLTVRASVPSSQSKCVEKWKSNLGAVMRAVTDDIYVYWCH